MSQTVDVSTLEQCIAMETEELKLRCFEAIIAGSTAGEETTSEPQESPADQSLPAPVIPAASATVGDAPDNEAAIAPAASVPNTSYAHMSKDSDDMAMSRSFAPTEKRRLKSRKLFTRP